MFIARPLIAAQEYFDDFNRANGALTVPWLSTAPSAINTNAAQNSTSSGNTPQFNFYDKQLGSDNFKVTTTLKLPVGTNRTTTTYFYVFARNRSAATQTNPCVVLVASGAALSSGIYTYDGTSLTLHESISFGFSAGQTAGLLVEENSYTVLQNDIPMTSWADATNIVPRGEGNRGFGFGTQPYNSGIGFAHDQILAKDV